MKARVLWCVLAIAPLVAAGCATAGNRTFGNETQPPGSAVTQAPGAVVIPPPPQPVVVQSAPAPVVVSPGQSVVVQPAPSGQPVVVQSGTVTVPASQIVQADALEATEVRAQTIYANRIQSNEIRGTIHQSGGVKIDRSVANLKTSDADRLRALCGHDQGGPRDRRSDLRAGGGSSLSPPALRSVGSLLAPDRPGPEGGPLGAALETRVHS